MSVLVYALVQTVDHSWTAPRTIGLFVAAFALLAGFIATERAGEGAADAAADLPQPVAVGGQRRWR